MNNTFSKRLIRRESYKNKKRKTRKNILLIISIIFILSSAIIIFKNIYNKAVKASVDTEKINRSSNVDTKYKSIDGGTAKVIAKSLDLSAPDGQVSAATINLKYGNQINGEGVNAEDALVKDGKKVAYLTFDDGPSTTVTPKILDVLKKYSIKATFFLVGQNVESNEESKEIVKRSFSEGNALGNHTYTHNLRKLYPNNIVNVDYFMSEVDHTNKILKNILGENFNTRLIRMPGGYMSRQYYKDPNLNAFNAKLKENNMYSIDWNAYDADSEGKKRNSEELLNVVKRTVGNQEKVIILMHDIYGKEETAKALPQIIEYLKAQGYDFKTLK